MREVVARRPPSGQGPNALALYRQLKEIVEACGPVTEVANKTRFGWMVRARFAGVVRLSEQGMTARFWLKRRIESPRFTRVEHLLNDDWVFLFPVTRPEELDEDVEAWVREAYEVGAQPCASGEKGTVPQPWSRGPPLK